MLFEPVVNGDAALASLHSAIWNQVLIKVRKVVARLGVEHVAGELGMTTSALDRALEDEGRGRLSGQQLVELQRIDESMEVAAVVAGARGMQLVPQKPMTPEEEVARWRSMADRMGEHGEWMKRQVFGAGKVKP